MGAPALRPSQVRPAPQARPRYQQFQSVYTSTVERIAEYFATTEGDSTQLSDTGAQAAAQYLHKKADQLSFSSKSSDANLANVYTAYAKVFDNLTRALRGFDRSIDTIPNEQFSQRLYGQLYLGSRGSRSGSELRALAARTGTVNVLSFNDFNA